MAYQVRVTTIAPGVMETFVEEWTATVNPWRRCGDASGSRSLAPG